jgi:hypothetical protein
LSVSRETLTGASSPIPACGTCHFGRIDKDNDLNCHRNPPAVFLRVDDKGEFRPVSVFPLMESDLWCGEWRSRDAPIG